MQKVCFKVPKLNNNSIKFVADSGTIEHLTKEVECLSELGEVTKMKGANKNVQADLEIKMKSVIKTKDSVGCIIKLKNVLHNENYPEIFWLRKFVNNGAKVELIKNGIFIRDNSKN